MIDNKKTTQVNFRVEEDFLKEIDSCADNEYMDRAAFIRMAIKKEVQRIQKIKLLEEKRLENLNKEYEIIQMKISTLKSKKSLTDEEKGIIFDLLEEGESIDQELLEIQAREYSKSATKENTESFEKDREDRRRSFINQYS